MEKIFQLIFVGALVVAAAVAEQNSERPYRVPMCLKASGPAGEDVSTNVWSDMIDEYKKRYPGSTCGSCSEEKPCPSKEKK